MYYSRLRCLHATSPSTSGMVTRGASRGLSFWVALWQQMDFVRGNDLFGSKVIHLVLLWFSYSTVPISCSHIFMSYESYVLLLLLLIVLMINVDPWLVWGCTIVSSFLKTILNLGHWLRVPLLCIFLPFFREYFLFGTFPDLFKHIFQFISFLITDFFSKKNN